MHQLARICIKLKPASCHQLLSITSRWSADHSMMRSDLVQDEDRSEFDCRTSQLQIPSSDSIHIGD